MGKAARLGVREVASSDVLPAGDLVTPQVRHLAHPRVLAKHVFDRTASVGSRRLSHGTRLTLSRIDSKLS